MRPRARLALAVPVAVVATLLTGATAAAPSPAPEAACAASSATTTPAGAKVTEAGARRGETEPYVEAAYRRALRAGTLPPAVRRTSAVAIPVHVHVVQKDASTGAVSDATVAAQVAALNAGYSGTFNPRSSTDTGFRFVLADVTRTVEPDWWGLQVDSAAESAMKSQLRVGGVRELNLYVTKLTGAQLGWSTFPDELARRPWMDGVVVGTTTLPGGTAPYDRGGTAVHETGHWLGLFHTFQDGCSPGDLVGDTAPEASAAYECPVGRDTCSDDGKDPIHNFMDYTDDSCLWDFSPGQQVRMDQQVRAFRNTAPYVGARSLTTTGAPVSTDVTDPEGDPVTLTASAGARGTTRVEGHTVTYTPTSTSQPDAFVVTATDAYGAVSTTRVDVNGQGAAGVATVSTTSATTIPRVTSRRRLPVTVTVRTGDGTPPTGPLTVLDAGRVVGTGYYAGATTTLRLTGRIGKGRRVLTVSFGGSSTVTASSTTVKVRVVAKRRR